MGEVFNRDHSTIHSNVKSIESALRTDTVLDAIVTEIRKELKR
jgi:chromosomal replication initiation ATPase DnaA